jgi:diaminopimelate epimerase
VELEPAFIRRLADRRFGIGCDQILLVESPRRPDTVFHYRIFNADGSEVEQCGNGARCFARFVREQGLSDQDEIAVGTAAGVIKLRLQADGQVRVNMGAPVLIPAQIPFLAERPQPVYPLRVGDETVLLGAVSMGNPHAVLQVDDVETAEVARLGPLLESHPSFPQRVNVGFMQVITPQHVRLRVYERGTGETLACGTGACAAVVSGWLRKLLAPQVRVSLPGGDLLIEWCGPPQTVWMTGPAATVFHGEIDRSRFL